MALERALPVWTARLRLSEEVWAGTLLVRGSFTWIGADASDVADRVRSVLQKELDEGGLAGAPLTTLPELLEARSEVVTVDLPRRTGVHDALRFELPVVVARAQEGAWLAVAPGLGVSWPGGSAEEAREGLRQRVVLELLAREDLGDGAALLGIVQVRAVEAAREERSFSFPTFGEVREAKKARDKLLEKVTRPFRFERRGAFELGRELDALARAVGANRSVLLVGPHGGGKTSLVRELVRSRGAELFGGRPVREVDAAGLLLALMEGGEGWQQPLSRLAAELAEQRGWLYVGNLAELFEVGRYEGNETSLAEHLRAPLTRGDVRLLAECTPEEVAAIEARHPGHLDAFSRIVVPMPGLSLEAVVRSWAQAHGGPARFHDDALREILRLHRRFFPYSGYPGKTLRALDAIAATSGPVDVDRDVILTRFCAESGLPRALVDPLAPLPYEEIRAFFEARLFGQPAALDAIVDTLAAVKADVARWGRPLASLLLAGPTGVGKTEAARATAEFLFGSASRMTRFDMSEYATPGAVARLVGGADGEGLLTGAVRRQPFSVVLFDELEKAHPAFLDLLLQVLGEGRLTDARGRTADFSSAVVLMTSNVGAVEARRGAAGFARAASAEREARYREAVAAWLRPELLNRIDRVLAFDALGPASIERVLDRELARFRARPGLEGLPFELAPAARERLARAGYHPAWGARQLLRVVHDQLAAPVARALNGWREGVAPAVRVELDGDALAVRIAPSERDRAEDAGDADHARARALQRRLRDVIEGGVYAEREAHLQALDRARERRRPAWGEDPEPLRTLLVALREQTEAARLVERAAGMAALRGQAEPDVAARIAKLGAEALKLARALVEASRPSGSLCVVAVYGREGVDRLVGLYMRLSERLGLTVEPATLYLRSPEAPPEEPKGRNEEPKGRKEERVVESDTFWLDAPGRQRPKVLGLEVGVELRVTGPAAVLLFAEEPGVTLWSATGRTREARVRVELFEGDRAAWEGRRPKEVHRKHYFADTPRRVIGPKVEERAERWVGADLAALERRLAERFEERVYEALSS